MKEEYLKGHTLMVIRSCTTVDQLLVASKYAVLAARKINDRTFAGMVDRALWARFHDIKELVRKGQEC